MARLDFKWGSAYEVVWRAIVFVVALAILIIVITRWNSWQGAPGWQATDDAYLQADITAISSHVAGYVQAVPVQDFEHVKAGQLIAQVQENDYRASVAQVEAALASAKAQAEAIKAQRTLQQANVAAARAVAAGTSATLQQNGRDLERQRRLMASGSSSKEAGEKLETVGAQLAAQLAQNRAQADAAERQIAVLAAQAEQAAASVKAQEAALELAHINLGYTRITAPADGVLGQRQVKPGQLVGIGTQITSLTPLPNLWVIANYRETQITHMAVGQRAEIRVDAFPRVVLKGHVVGFAPGSGSQFALLPPDNATGNFTKVVQRVAVKIAIDDAAGLSGRLRAGLSVIARIDADDRSVR